MKNSRHGSIRRVLVPELRKTPLPPASVSLDSGKTKHLRKVLRMEWGEKVLAHDGGGRVFEATLEKEGEWGSLRIDALLSEDKNQPEELILNLCMPKNATMDWIVEKAVECGVTRIRPIASSRSIVKPKTEEIEKYAERWQTIMDEAVEQCERVWRPTIEDPQFWDDWILTAKSDGPAYVFVSEGRDAIDDQSVKQETWSELAGAPKGAMQLLIGPEGGFAATETEQVKSKGFKELRLGKAVLRVETAAIVALTLARFARAQAHS